jgi:hypothetical protein
MSLDSQYVGDDQDSKCKRLSIAENLELANFLVSLQNAKINDNFLAKEIKNPPNSKNITNPNANYGTDNFNFTSSKESDGIKRKIDKKINCNIIFEC